MGSVLDLHCHTVHGSLDSELSAALLVKTARQTGLTACCITEHDKMWERHYAENLSRELNISFIRGMEVTTNLGHMLVYGLDRYVSGIHDAHALRRTVLARGGLMIAAHPFRKLLLQVRYNHNSPKQVIPSHEEACNMVRERRPLAARSWQICYRISQGRDYRRRARGRSEGRPVLFRRDRTRPGAGREAVQPRLR